MGTNSKSATVLLITNKQILTQFLQSEYKKLRYMLLANQNTLIEHSV